MLLADHPLESGYEYFANKRVPNDPDAPKGYPPGGARSSHQADLYETPFSALGLALGRVRL